MGRFSLSVGLVWIKYKHVGLKRPGEEMGVYSVAAHSVLSAKELGVLSEPCSFGGRTLDPGYYEKRTSGVSC
jgi:hypothetical protein